MRNRLSSPFLLLFSAVVLLILVLPVGYLGMRAFTGTGRALEILFADSTLMVLGRTLLLVASVSITGVLIAVPLAWLTSRTDLPYKRFFSVLLALPLVIPSYVAAYIAVVLFGPKGNLQTWLAPYGVERIPDIYGFPGAFAVLALLTYPYIYLPVRAAFERTDPALEESARALGMSGARAFWTVTFPLVSPAVIAGALLVALYTLGDFGAVSILGFETFTWAIYLQYEAAIDRTVAAALSLELVAVVIFVVALAGVLRRKTAHYRIGAGVSRTAAPVALGRLRLPAVVGISLFLCASLAAPAGLLVYWAWLGINAGVTWETAAGLAVNSFTVSSAAALLTVAVALPLAFASVRRRGVVARIVEFASATSFALPGIVVALALVFFGIRAVPIIYQTHFLLVLAYLILFLHTALGSTSASWEQLNPRVEETARTLRAGPLRVFSKITFPLIRPGVFAAISIVFLLSMKELPATLILGPLDFKTLATSVWSSTSEALFFQASVPALLIIVLSSIPLSFLIGRKEAFR